MMIEAIEIENLRGIKHGKLEGLAALTILTGPNGCGKSTVLDALLAGGSDEPWNALVALGQRRRAVRRAPAFLVRGGKTGQKARTIVTATDQPAFDRTLVFSTEAGNLTLGIEANRNPIGSIGFSSAAWSFAGELQSTTQPSHAPEGVPVTLIDPGNAEPVDAAVSELARRGQRSLVISLLGPLLPGLQNIELLAEPDGTTQSYLIYPDRAVPVGVSGDGVQALAQMACALVQRFGGTVLIEEPEVFQHPRSIRQIATLIVAAVERGVQIVLTTHSLELIDALLARSQEQAQLANVAVFNLGLTDGVLASVRRDGVQALEEREQIGWDLR